MDTVVITGVYVVVACTGIPQPFGLAAAALLAVVIPAARRAGSR